MLYIKLKRRLYIHLYCPLLLIACGLTSFFYPRLGLRFALALRFQEQIAPLVLVLFEQVGINDSDLSCAQRKLIDDLRRDIYSCKK